jgi:sulfur relay (sulfurtransferase) complex TusBCD TusD component (DsrE family)
MNLEKRGYSIVVATILLAVGMLVVMLSFPSIPANAQAQTKQKVVVHLTHYTDGLHAAFMALHLARSMQESGAAEVTLFVDVEAVRLADRRQPQDLAWKAGGTISTHYDGFVKAGGKVLVCPHCAEVAGLTSQSLRPGARIAADLKEVANAILAADKVIDY